MIHANPIYALLSAANLARMRGHWDEAIGKCAEALRLDPANPNAYSLVGDIYQDQGRSEEAIQWYQMALDIDPDNEADRLKIERLKMPTVANEKPPAPSFWVRVVVPAGAVVVFLMMAVGLAVLWNARNKEPRVSVISNDAPALASPPLPPVKSSSDESSANLSQEPLEKIETAREYALHGSLSKALKKEGELQIFYVQMDPGTADTIVSFFYRPSGGSLNTAGTLRAAYLVTGAAMRENLSMDACSTRVYVSPRGSVAPEVALTALARRESFINLAPDAIPEALARSFERLSWNPYLFPSAPIFKPNPPSSGDPSATSQPAYDGNAPS